MSRWPWVPKPGAGGDAVLVDDTQVAHAHVGRVVVVGEGKAVEALQPAVVGEAPVGGFAQRHHAPDDEVLAGPGASTGASRPHSIAFK
jgi:hypothetical protein